MAVLSDDSTVSVLGALDVFGLDPNQSSGADLSSSEGKVGGPAVQKAALSLGGATGWQVVVRSQVKAYHLPLEQFKRLPNSMQRVRNTYQGD